MCLKIYNPNSTEVATQFLPVRGRNIEAIATNQILFAVTSAMLLSSDNLFTNCAKSSQAESHCNNKPENYGYQE